MQRSIVMAEISTAAATDVVAAFADAPTALIADCDRAVVALGAPIAAMTKRSRVVGEALTIRAGSLAQWKALELARPGQVLIISCNGRRDCAEFGAIYVRIALAKGVAAIVTDGLIRDRDEIAELDLPVFACGTHPASPADPAPGGVGLPVKIHEASIGCGDIVVCDEDGLVVIPRAAIASVRENLSTQRVREEGLQRSVREVAGQLPERIRDALANISFRDS